MEFDMVLLRTQKTSTFTRGVLVVNGSVFHTIERPWKGNRRRVSCIPPGVYDFSFLPVSGSGKYRNTYHIHRVQGRSGILIHNGNLVRHSLGCVIIGSKPGRLAGKPAVLGSRKALRKLNKVQGPKGGRINII